jgi:hypothetical protein
MDFEAPVDAWYVWLGVAMVSVAVAGVALAFPTTPPPDANAAANAVDNVAGDPYGGTASYEHDGNEYWVGLNQFALKNDGGVSQASVRFGEVAPVWPDSGLRSVLDGEDPKVVFDSEADFESAVETAQQEGFQNWYPASGTLRAKTVIWGDNRVTLIAA